MKAIFLVLFCNVVVYANMAKVEVIDNGVKRVISTGAISQTRGVDSLHKGFLVEFKDGVDAKSFAKKYHLIIKKKMLIGYFVLENRSKYDDITILKEIIKNDSSSIKTIRPNWKRANLNR